MQQQFGYIEVTFIGNIESMNPLVRWSSIESYISVSHCQNHCMEVLTSTLGRTAFFPLLEEGMEREPDAVFCFLGVDMILSSDNAPQVNYAKVLLQNLLTRDT